MSDWSLTSTTSGCWYVCSLWTASLSGWQGYAAALRRHAAGKEVLDIGTGPFCLLARLALGAGARSVTAVEHAENAVATAIEYLRHERDNLDRPPCNLLVDEEVPAHSYCHSGRLVLTALVDAVVRWSHQ